MLESFLKKIDFKKLQFLNSIIDKFKFLKSIPPAITIFTITVISFTLLFPYTSDLQQFDIPKVGDAAKETIIAPFTFDIIRANEELERERRKAVEQVLMVLQYFPETRSEVRKKFIQLRENITAFSRKRNSDPLKISIQQKLEKELSLSTITSLSNEPSLIDDALYMSEDILDKGVSGSLVVPSSVRLSELRNQYNTKFEKYALYNLDFVSLRKGTLESTIRVNDIQVKEVALEDLMKRLKKEKKYNDESLNVLYELLFVYLDPNVQINTTLTQVRKEKAAKDVLSIAGKVIKDTEIVRKHQEVTPEIVAKLRSLQSEYSKRGDYQEKKHIQANNIGRLLFTLLPLLFIAFYIYKFEKQFMREYKHLAAFAIILILQVVIMRVGVFLSNRFFDATLEVSNLIIEFVIPLSTGAILAGILFNFRFAFILTLYSCILADVMIRPDYHLFFYNLFGGIVCAYTVKNIRYRLHFFRVIPPVMLVYILVIALWQFTGYKTNLMSLLHNGGLGLISIISAILLSMMLTPLFERLFDITTDMTLVELSDMNHPILKRLSIEAAGTYNHSVLVGNLAESAAEKIGANALLARVASYYHDIGKIEKSDYFVENCLPVERNRHNKLAPSMSALIICSHVKDGAELAASHKIPKVIQDVILQHHGTSTVSFFYEKALEQDPHKQVQEQDFRYAGPIPQTREAAIIMLADSVEAASRSLGTSSPKLLRELVKKIIRDKFLSSQLDQSDLTLKDLDLIIEGFMPVLQGIFHSRVEYPKGA
jgi:putative nucleotidyltransferase with HDIG domain